MDQVRRTILKRMQERGLNYKEVSLELGKNAAYMQQFMERNIPAKLKEDVRSRLSEILDLPEGDLGAPERTDSRSADDKSKDIPEIDLVAGLGAGGFSALEQTSRNGITFAKEVVRDHWRLPEWMLARMGVKALHVAAFPAQGDSMSPTIADGDVVFIDTRHRVPSPDGIYALADEFGGVVVKRLEVTSRPGAETVTVKIISDNPRHSEREFTLDEIHIVGRYIGRFTV
ncbi:S24 family peptidase [Sinorhizobium fredii]|uniref:Peptidase S24 family/phage repressor domain-containing protein n=1 Tax=Rhizobium fredii TaxID=380 RepID=A0A2L0H4G3_RHIFR|nr:S24 family peptidase [Sinorhizobium fredii]AUX76376.1 peptidase S24 family/phage repressor domain-containing protein [Sinorhizobium fredii]